MDKRFTLTAWQRIYQLDGFDAERIARFIDAHRGDDYHRQDGLIDGIGAPVRPSVALQAAVLAGFPHATLYRARRALGSLFSISAAVPAIPASDGPCPQLQSRTRVPPQRDRVAPPRWGDACPASAPARTEKGTPKAALGTTRPSKTVGLR
jgi:hypothetical protein